MKAKPARTRKKDLKASSGTMARNPFLTAGAMNLRCGTRALKNAKYLQKTAPHILPEREPPEGFASIIPLSLLAQLHIPGRRGKLAADARLAKLLKDVEIPLSGTIAVDSLFSGTLHFVRIQCTVQSQKNAIVSVSAADMATALSYATQAAIPISKYAAQYGPNSVAVSQTILNYAVKLADTTYNNATLEEWVNDIKSANHLPSNDCVAVLNPKGLVNVDAAISSGWGGFHSMADLPYVFVNMKGENITVADVPFVYAGDLSHEIAGMVVDPLGNEVNPEVCDPCGPNCASTYLDYFDNAGNL